MKRWLIAGIVSGVVLTSVAWGAGKGGPGDGPDGKMGRRGGDGPRPEAALGHLMRNPEAAREAGLTDEQIAAVQEASYKHRKAMIALDSQLENARLELQHLMSAASVDVAAVEKAMDDVAAKEAAISKAWFRHRTEIKSIVGEETLQKIAEKAREARGKDRDDRGPRGKGKGDRRGGPGGGMGQGPCQMPPDGPGSDEPTDD